jgi:hypothetical protein
MEGFEIVERARDARAQLLAVERAPLAPREDALGSAILLVFDVGRVLVSVTGMHLVIRHIESSDDAPSGLLSCQEEEPWWRLLGCALSGAAVVAGGAGLRLELTSGGPESRFVELVPGSGGVRSTLVDAPSGAPD